MCNEYNQIVLDDNKEYCICCNKQFENGESVYFRYDEELFCIDCISNMTTEEIIKNFLQEEII